MVQFSIASDHGGLDLKKEMVTFFKEEGYTYVDHGTDSLQSVDYPDYAALVAKDIIEEQAQWGVLICRSGIGISIAANKLKGIRAALIKLEDDAEYARRHNNANIICLGAKHTTAYLAKKFIKIFLSTPFDADRHGIRIEKIRKMEQWPPNS